MPIDNKVSSTFFSQREQYAKGGVGRWYWDFRDKKILSLIGERHKDILDVGCGEGIMMEKIKVTYPDRKTIGMDALEENIIICKKNNLLAETGSVYNMEKYKNSEDLIIFSEVIEHLENPERAVENIYNSLKPGGEAIIVFPNDLIFKIVRIMFLMFKEAFADLGHVRQFTPKSVSHLLKSKGFNVRKKINTPFIFWPFSLHCIILAQKI